MGKFYLHPSATLRNGKVYCDYCGQELPLDEKGLPTLQTNFPCIVSPPTPFDSEVEINVWNCRAVVFYRGKPIDFSRLPKASRDKLERLALDSVHQAGGAINWSGIYPPSDELCKYVAWLKKRGYIGDDT